MENRVTLKELSKLLNVSISTVSKALRDSPEISPETRKKVKELAELNQYVPNALAQNLKNRKTKTIGVIIPSILPHFLPRRCMVSKPKQQSWVTESLSVFRMKAGKKKPKASNA